MRDGILLNRNWKYRKVQYSPCDIRACTDRAPFSFRIWAANVRVLPVSIMSSTRIAACGAKYERGAVRSDESLRRAERMKGTCFILNVPNKELHSFWSGIRLVVTFAVNERKIHPKLVRDSCDPGPHGR